MPTKPKPKGYEKDEITALMIRVPMALRGGNGERALDQLFFTASQKHLPGDWRRSLKKLTKMLRRSVGFQENAKKAAKRGSATEAWRLLGLAREALAVASDGVLIVGLSGPSTSGELDLWDFVVRDAHEMIHATATYLLRFSGPSMRVR